MLLEGSVIQEIAGEDTGALGEVIERFYSEESTSEAENLAASIQGVFSDSIYSAVELHSVVCRRTICQIDYLIDQEGAHGVSGVSNEMILALDRAVGQDSIVRYGEIVDGYQTAYIELR